MKSRNSRAFALPTVLISSIIMLIVMLSAVTSTVAVRVSLDSQYNDHISRNAGDAGVAYAKACLSANNGISRWTNAKPLKPDTDCYGNQLASCPANPAGAECHYVSNIDNNVTSFSVGLNETPPVSSWKKVTSGYSHTCGIASDDKAYCWGSNLSGELGNGSTKNSFLPIPVNADGYLKNKTITSISAGEYFSCAMTSEKKVYCWGSNVVGQLGNGTTNESHLPLPIDDSGVLVGKTIQSISAGNRHVCVIANGGAYCWGSDNSGQLGNNNTSDWKFPAAVDTSGVLNGKTVTSVSAGNEHTCAIADNKAYCWGGGHVNGTSQYGQLGNNSSAKSPVPVAVKADEATDVLYGKNISSISTGIWHTCAIDSDGKVYCWGNGSYGGLGDGLATTSLVPVAVKANEVTDVLYNKNVKSISTGFAMSCAVTTEELAYCWGHGGDLGNNGSANSNVPYAVYTAGVLNAKKILSISTKGSHTAVIADNNQAYGWGDNDAGMLGNNSLLHSNIPVAVNVTDVIVKNIKSVGSSSLLRKSDNSVWRGYSYASLLNLESLSSSGDITAVQIAVGDYHVCAISSSNKAYCWGSNIRNSLGDNSSIDSHVATAVYSDGVIKNKTLKSITAGRSHACAVDDLNVAYCWGDADRGQLGVSSYPASPVPKAVNVSGSALAGKTVKRVSGGLQHSCLLASDNLAYCTGSNAHGQLGNESVATSTPVYVAVDTSGLLSGKLMKSVVTGQYHSCAVTIDDGGAYCWGYNNYGQLGNNSTSSSPIPVAVKNDQPTDALYGKTISSISSHMDHTCVVASDEKIYCWGLNSNGQLGNNSTVNSSVPVPVDMEGVLKDKTILSISVGSYNTCVVASDHKAYCWGYIVGDGTYDVRLTPVAVDTSGVLSGRNILAISSGAYNTCVIADNGLVYCWGDNTAGKLGDNSTTSSPVPVVVRVVDKYMRLIKF